MIKFFCSTKDKEVNIQIDNINSPAREDISVQTIPGRKTCMENMRGDCYEFENCPLTKK